MESEAANHARSAVLKVIPAAAALLGLDRARPSICDYGPSPTQIEQPAPVLRGDRGRGTLVGHPSLQTGLADLPHPALQSASPFLGDYHFPFVGRTQTEQPTSGKPRVRVPIDNMRSVQTLRSTQLHRTDGLWGFFSRFRHLRCHSVLVSFVGLFHHAFAFLHPLAPR